MDFKLILGYECNMKCNYCYQLKSHSLKKNMSYEIIDKFIERFNKLKGKHNIDFFGGEPLLYVDKIKYIMDRIDKKHSISISTNGSLRGEFYELEKYWGSSITNLLSNKEHKNLNKLNENSFFRFVATKKNISELTDELINFLAREYRKNIQFKYDLSEKWELEEVKKMEEVQKKFQYILGKDFRIDLPVNYNSVGECFVRNQVCFINWNGDYLACHRIEESKLGNILNDDFKYCNNNRCIYESCTNLNNLYSYGKYEFKGTSLFHMCH